MNLNFSIFIILIYLLSTLLGFASYLKNNTSLQKVSKIFLGLGFFLHTAELSWRYLLHFPQSLNIVPFYFSLLAWIIIFLLLLIFLRLKINFLLFLASPLSLLFYMSHLLLSFKLKGVLPAKGVALWFGLHIVSLFLSFAFLALAFGSGLIYLYLEKKIKTKSKLPSFSNDLPSLTTFDRLNHLAVVCGFPLFSPGVFTGFIWAIFSWKSFFTWDPKEIVALFIWILYAYLFHQRLALGWKGKKPAKMAIFLFILSLISLMGINLLMPTHHSFRP